MNSHLAPTYEKLVDDFWLLWYSKSNCYSIVDDSFKTILKDYLTAENIDVFKSNIAFDDEYADTNLILENLNVYLKNCNLSSTIYKVPDTDFDKSRRTISRAYHIKGKTITVYYGCDYALNATHPAIAHYNTNSKRSVDTTFDIYIKDDTFVLYKDKLLLTSAPLKDFHLIQGKFIMHLLCTLFEKQESDWIGSFHGSTLTDGDSGILFVGDSGKGKSTLCALLATQGFDLLADDLSPMSSSNSSIYYNPLALSLKAGAFNLLQPLLPNFDTLPLINFKASKGPIKYIPFPSPEKDHYPCRSIVLVNYQPESATTLEAVSVKTVLEVLIPDSWLSSNPLHAQQFLEWLESVEFYKLTYSNTKSVTKEVSALFKKLKNH